MKRDILKATKATVGFVSGCGVNIILKTIINNNVHPQHKAAKVAVWVGRVAVTGLINDKVREHTDAKIDDIAKGISEFKNTIKG